MKQSLHSHAQALGHEPIEPIVFRPPRRTPPLPRLQLPLTTLVVGAILLLVAAAAWYVLSARSVRIQVDPTGAHVQVPELLAPHLGDHWLLLPGTHAVHAELDGYQAYAGELLITDEVLQTQRLALRPLPGKLRVTVTPVTSADIRIDGQLVATAPTTVDQVEAGMREIEVTAERYLPLSLTLEIEGRRKEQALAATLKPAWAEFSITTRPTGGTVSVGDKVLGQTPLNAELFQGDREVVVRLKGYKPWTRRMKVVAGQAIKLPEIALTKADGNLQVATTPVGAAITVDGKYKGVTPLKLALAPDLVHDVLLFKEGYVPARLTARVDAEENKELTTALEPELARVQLITDPADAELLVDGQPSGSANQTLNLPTFEHELIIRKAGYASFRTMVTPRQGVEKRLRIELKTAAEMAREEAAAPTPAAATAPATTHGGTGEREYQPLAEGQVRSAAGQILKLFNGGEFMLGATRGDREARDNETVHPVRLSRPFYLALKEVTNREYREFMSGHRTVGPSGRDGDLDLDGEEQPVANVSWEAAAQYCNWLSRRDSLPVFYQIKYGKVLGINPDATGYRLPTEAEWEWTAAVAPDGEKSVFPWSGKSPPRGRAGNYAERLIADYDDGVKGSAPVGSFPANPRGLYDMGGNVAEWVNDVYTVTPPAYRDVAVDPTGPSTGNEHTIRGSSWAQAAVAALRLSYREAGSQARNDLGFRIARYAE